MCFTCEAIPADVVNKLTSNEEYHNLVFAAYICPNAQAFGELLAALMTAGNNAGFYIVPAFSEDGRFGLGVRKLTSDDVVVFHDFGPATIQNLIIEAKNSLPPTVMSEED